MKCEIKTTKTYTLELSQEERDWLLTYIDNATINTTPTNLVKMRELINVLNPPKCHSATDYTPTIPQPRDSK